MGLLYEKSKQGGILKLSWQEEERGLAKCQRYNISLCSKLVNEAGGGGVKNPLVNVWMPQFVIVCSSSREANVFEMWIISFELHLFRCK